MFLGLVTVVIAVSLVQYGSAAVTHHPTTHAPVQTHPPTTPDPMEADLGDLKQNVEAIARQMMMQQLFVEERVRSDGATGLKQIRQEHYGTKPYLSEAHTGDNIGGLIDIALHSNELGMKDNNYVMNGVDFRTRVNFYKLNMPSRTSGAFHQTERIPPPDVPPSVLSKNNITEQINEMSEYFRAFKNQDTKIRDYKNYFKPVVCYLEGAWFDLSTRLNPSAFNNDHYENYWFNGGVSDKNYPFLPTTIMKVVNGTPYYGHWDYRTVCHPIKKDLALKSIYLVDDLAPRLRKQKGVYDFGKTHAARFQLARNNGHNYKPDLGYGEEYPAASGYTILDAIMEEIPGKNNYPAKLNDKSFGLTPFNAHFGRNQTELNTGYYHRWYKVGQKGAMGTTVIYRGYSDQFLFVAQTTQERVAPMSYNACQYNRTIHKEQCNEYVAKYSYAIPLEIVWMTPLMKWNPYNLHYYSGDPFKAPANTVNAHGRNGGNTAQTAYNGVNDRLYFTTPYEFYDSHSPNTRVLDQHGQIRRVSAAGISTFTSSVKGVGPVRLRYPIMPLHLESNAVYKQLDALKEMVMNMAKNARFFEEAPVGLYSDDQDVGQAVIQHHYVTSRSDPAKGPPAHTHDVYITADMRHEIYSAGKNISVYTTLNEGHMHMLDLHSIPRTGTVLRIVQCDGMDKCFDGHSHDIYYMR